MKKEIIYWIKRIKTYFLVLFYALGGKFYCGTIYSQCKFLNSKIGGNVIILKNCTFENAEIIETKKRKMFREISDIQIGELFIKYGDAMMANSLDHFTDIIKENFETPEWLPHKVYSEIEKNFFV